MAETISGRDHDFARNMAMLGYGLLFASIFFAGIPGLVAVIIAYTQRPESPPDLRSHYDFQVRIFWVAFALSIASAACLLSAVVSGVAEFVTENRIEALMGPDEVNIDLSRVSIDGRVIGLSIAAALLAFCTALWLVAAPAVGFIRLASAQRIGHSPAR